MSKRKMQNELHQDNTSTASPESSAAAFGTVPDVATPPRESRHRDGVHAATGRPRRRAPRGAVPILALLVALLIGERVAAACYACAAWTNWGERIQVCASPSEGLLADALTCQCSGPCAAVCADWCSSLDACAVSGEPNCEPDAATSDCSHCVEGTGAFTGIGCAEVTDACSADLTGCATCSEWLDGADPDLVCANKISDAILLEHCACSSCPACASACTQGYLDTSIANFACGACLGSACAAQLSLCEAP